MVTSVVAAPPRIPTATVVALAPAADGAISLSDKTTPAAAGTVQFLDGSVVLGVQTLAAGQAQLSATLPPGSHVLSAIFTPTDMTAYGASLSASVNYTVSTGAQSLPVPPSVPSNSPAPSVMSGLSGHTGHTGRSAAHSRPPANGPSWFMGADFTGIATNVIYPDQPGITYLERRPAEVPAPVLAADAPQPAPARVIAAAASAADYRYLPVRSQRVALLPSLLIVVGVTTFVAAAYSKRKQRRCPVSWRSRSS